MEREHQPNSEQAALWNGHAGHAWVEVQPGLDRMFEPLERLLVQALPGAGGGSVLDVGCGTGSTTLALARHGGSATRCVGIDISAPMIELARRRAQREGSPARFVLGDAQTHAFEPGGFDTLVSRFGVMFFDDPVRAFSNLRHAANDGAHLMFAAWRSAAENPFMTTAERAAAPLLPQLAERKANGPGQFAFADRQRVHDVLESSGWSEVDLQPLDVACRLPTADLPAYIRWMGPVGVALQKTDDAIVRQRAIDAARAAFEPYVRGDEVGFTASCWIVRARARPARAVAGPGH